MGRIADADAERLAISGEARALHERSLVVDMHVDSLIQRILFGYDPAVAHEPGPGLQARALPYDLLRIGLAQLKRYNSPLYFQADGR